MNFLSIEIMTSYQAGLNAENAQKCNKHVD